MNKSKWMSLVLASTILSLPLISACTVEAHDPQEQTATTGTVAMALSTVTNGTTYRLANAAFLIDGPSSTVLQATQDPAESVLSTVLATGDYEATLASGWILQRNDGAEFVNVQANLVSPNPVAFTILDGQRTDLVFQFDTNGTIITIGTGELGISIAVNETGSGGSCEPFGAGCGANEWCLSGELIGGDNICLPSGTVPVNAACVDQECVTNAVCADLQDGLGARCIELCPAGQIGLPCAGGGGTCSDQGSTVWGACF